MKEMVGGCCVCSDERGWPENPLVYCDGQNCTVAVHQACYGIVTVPTGPWYCRKCESQERSARVRCELCPSRDGALKKTDNQGWAHVVCALYIPEVRFGNVTTMEPIILQLIPPERYSKTCYICQEIGKGSRANVGACMQCNKSGCKQQFHVTCAQGLGLLCEEAGNYLDNVKYCGYCQHHYSKLKKGGNVKTIPPYKPITHETGSSDATSSPEKELEPNIIVSTQSSTSTNIKLNSNQNANSTTTAGPASSSSTSSSKQRKSTSTSKMTGSSSSSSSSANVINNSGSGNTGINTTSSTNSSSNKSSSNSSSSSKDKDKHGKSLSKISSSSKNQDKESSSTSSSTTTSTRDKSKSSKNNKDSSDHSSNSTITSTNSSLNTSGNNIANNLTITTGGNTKDTLGQKFTTSNFTESIVIQSESVFGSNETVTTTTSTNSTTSSSSTSTSKSSSSSLGKKRKADTIKLSATNLGLDNVDLNNSNLSFRDIIKDVSVTLIPLPIDKTDNTDNDNKSIKKPKTETNTSSPLNVSHEPNLQNLNPNLMGAQIAGNVTIKQPTLGALQQQPQQTTTSSTSSSSHIKPPILKDLGETRLRSSSPYNSSSAALGGSGATTPSLYVSVPLSTATVPGVNLPSTTSNVIEHVTQSQPSRSSPIVNHHHHPHSHHSSSSSNQSSSVERQSPRNHHNQSQTTSTTSQHPSEHSSATPSVQSTSGNVVIQTNVLATSSTNHGGNSGITSGSSTTLESGSLKITYEKQNLRVAQLQEEQLPARRSRSQSGDSSNKSRSGKKRSAANVVVVSNSVSSTSSSSSSSSTTSSMNIGSSTLPALPIGSNTGNETSSTATSSTVKTQNHSRHNEMHTKSSTAVVKINSNETSKNLAINSTSNAKTTSSSSSSNTNDVPIPPVVVAPNNSHLNNVNAKQLNKKLLRAQQTHSQQLQQQKPQQSISTPVSATENTTTTTTSSTHFSNDENPTNSTSSSNSRTPDNGNFNNNNTNSITISSNSNNNNSNNSTIVNSTFNNGGLKFTYESQIGSNIQSLTPPVIDIPPPVVKDSPPSSPGSEAGSARKRGRKSSDSKDIKLFHNGVHATHMLGNQLNPASSVAQKMSDQLHMEIEAHSVYTQPNLDPGPQLVGIPFPGKQSSTRSSSQSSGSNSLASMLGGSSATNASGNTPQSLEQLLERQWEQGSQFLMEQAQHFDIASLLSCLHQLRTENVRLEEHVNNLVARRDHLLAVNARLAIPLNPNLPQNQATLNNIHMNGPTTDNTTSSSSSTASRISRPNANFNAQPSSIPLENGIDFRHSSHPPPTGQTTISHN